MVTTLAFQTPLGEPGSILGRTSTQGLKIIEEKELYLFIDISNWLDFRVLSDKDVKIVGTSDPLQLAFLMPPFLGGISAEVWEISPHNSDFL